MIYCLLKVSMTLANPITTTGTFKKKTVCFKLPAWHLLTVLMLLCEVFLKRLRKGCWATVSVNFLAML